MKAAARSSWPPALGPALAAVILLSAAGAPAPRKWDLRLALQTSGVYQVVEKGITYDGDFAFTLIWSGTMEEDDQDYRLVQRDVQLLDWQAHETTAAPAVGTPKMTGDFPEKPAFLYLYVLNEKGFLTIEFALRGLSVPVHETADKIPLDLPRTAKNMSHESKIDYDAFLDEGTNLVQLPAEAISRKTVEKKFSWSWKHKQWVLGQEQVVFLSNLHKATAAIRIRPQPGRSHPTPLPVAEREQVL